MRFIHLSDLHIGKRVNDFSMIEDQKYVFKQVLEEIKKQQVDAVFISGDIYDKSVPSSEAVALYDSFITALADLEKHIFIINGNHDSAERISFASQIMEKVNVHIAPVFSGKMECVTMEDEYGEIDVYMLPFIKPGMVRRYYENSEIETYTDAVRVVIESAQINPERRNIILAHQFVSGAVTCESEELSVGGIDNVDAEVFKDFDYVALGHIHGPQKVMRENIRYCGTLLKYSFSEIKHKKSITVVDLLKKDTSTDNNNLNTEVVIKTIPVKPLHDLRHISGLYSDITSRNNYIDTDVNDYMYITLKDEEDILDAVAKLRSIYPNIMKLDYDNTRTKNNENMIIDKAIETKTPMELFCDFYKLQNGQDVSEKQKAYIESVIEDIWEAE